MPCNKLHNKIKTFNVTRAVLWSFLIKANACCIYFDLASKNMFIESDGDRETMGSTANSYRALRQ